MLVCICALKASAQDVLHLMINNKSVGQASTDMASPLTYQVSKSKYKNVRSIVLDDVQQSPVAVYKRSIEIVGDNDKQLFTTNESVTKAGRFIITKPAILKLLSKQNVLKVFLQQNPRNNMMGMPSRRNLLAELHMK